MKRLLALLAGLLGFRALLRRRARLAPVAEPPVEELRAKLAETKEPEPEPAPADDVDARRADVHERARQAIDELRD